MNLMDRFLSKVEKTDGCWVWAARKTPQGYGRISVGNVNRLAHRVAFELFVGAAGDLNVLHRCDNPSCVNPAHLWLGTNADNVADKVSKGRAQRLAGEANGRCKLTAEEVVAIRGLAAQGVGRAHLAGRFGVAPKYVNQIVRKASWRHV